MSLNRFRVITFDVVGTLIDFERGMINFIRDVDQKTAERLGDEHILNCYRHHRGNKPSKWFPDDLVRVCLAMAPDLGLPATPALADSFRDSIKRWPPFPDRSGCARDFVSLP
jgi:putative hydrolase of the HAD superfamily